MPTNDGPDWGQTAGLTAFSISGSQLYGALLDFARRLNVVEVPLWWYNPIGRVIYSEDFEATPLKWTQAAGTVARDTTTAHFGGACAKLTTGAVAGNAATARKFFHLAADQGSQQGLTIANRTARVYVGAYFRWADNNQRRFILRWTSDDTQTMREAEVIYHRRQAGVNSNALEYMNNLGTTTAAGTVYPIDDGTATLIDNWHFLFMELDYDQGSDVNGGYCWYRSIRMDDQIVKFAPGTVATHQLASLGVRSSMIDLSAETDVALASSVFVDDVMYADLSSALNQ